MRGTVDPQDKLFYRFDLESRVPEGHPLREIRRITDEVLARMSPLFDEIYKGIGRNSVPPEYLLKSQLLIALYSVRSDRQFCEMLAYNLLFRWFLGMDLEARAMDHSTFTKNRKRLLEHEVANRFFGEVIEVAYERSLISTEHFSADGTLIKAWASLKSFREKGKTPPKPPADPGNPSVDFRGEKRTNQTHESTTDPECRLIKKTKYASAELGYLANAIMENRNGLLVGLEVRTWDGYGEREGAKDLLSKLQANGFRPTTLGADKGYHVREFVKHLRGKGIAPHIARKDGVRTPGLDGRTTRHEGYKISRRLRMRIEEIFGWAKSIGGLRQTRFRGAKRVGLHALFVGIAYNILRIAKLCTA